MRESGLILAAVLALGPTLSAGEAAGDAAPSPEAAPDPEDKRARGLVAQLGDNDWEKREAASRELATMGLAALPHVEAALKSADAEVAMRAKALIDAVRRNAQKEISERCLIKDLLFCGPFAFKKEETKPLDLSFAPETGIKTDAVYKGGEEGRPEARWRRPFPAAPRGPVDLDSVFGRCEHVVIYALASVKIGGDGKRKLLLLAGSDDSLRVWVNGTEVHCNATARGLKPDQDSVEVTLDPGWNDLLLKVANFGGPWGVCLRLTEVDRSEAEGLTWDPTRGGEREPPPEPPPEQTPVPAKEPAKEPEKKPDKKSEGK